MLPASTSGRLAQRVLADLGHLVSVPDHLIAQLQRETLSARSLAELSSMRTHDLSEVAGLLEVASRVREKLLFGPGFAILSGQMLESLSDAQLETMHFVVCVALGQPMWQNSARDLVVRVEDLRPEDPDRARGFTSNTRMLMHTDGWDCAGLMCLSEPVRGGASLFASSETVHDLIAVEAPDLLSLYFDPWYWDVRYFTDDPNRRPVQAPIFSRFDDQLSCRYSSSMLRNGAQFLGQDLGTDRLRALEVFEAVASRDNLVLRHQLRRGESVWMNNARVLHGREAFSDSNDGLIRRRLVRLWSMLDGAPRKAPEFTAFDALTFGQAAP